MPLPARFRTTGFASCSVPLFSQSLPLSYCGSSPGAGSVVAGILRIVAAFRRFRRSPAYIRRMFLQFLHDFLFRTRDEIGYAPKLARGRDICARSRAHYRPRIVRVPLKIRDRVPVPRVREEKFIRRSFAETRLLRFVRISIIAFAAVVFGTSGGAVSIRFVVVVCLSWLLLRRYYSFLSSEISPTRSSTRRPRQTQRHFHRAATNSREEFRLRASDSLSPYLFPTRFLLPVVFLPPFLGEENSPIFLQSQTFTILSLPPVAIKFVFSAFQSTTWTSTSLAFTAFTGFP